ncbi:MAG: 2Fe-2S iron-sulfur cluster binding domain-containing protein [Oscillatoriales cyanobacterium RM1_1_9]|nr:2Fe-2S iron-sulfur cluster binding domain-containing protein [Oscillatoriales cyanobacterium RM1_1_9]
MEVISSTVEGDHSDPELKAAAASAILVFAKSGKEIDCSAADSILDIADQGGIEIDSSCRSGTCGTCMQRVVQGEVCYEGEPEALTEGDRQQGQILTCIARPIGRVVIDL